MEYNLQTIYMFMVGRAGWIPSFLCYLLLVAIPHPHFYPIFQIFNLYFEINILSFHVYMLPPVKFYSPSSDPEEDETGQD